MIQHHVQILVSKVHQKYNSYNYMTNERRENTMETKKEVVFEKIIPKVLEEIRNGEFGCWAC